MARRKSIWEFLKWDLLVLFVLAILVLGFSFLQKPRFEPADSPRSEGSRPPDRTEGDILLLLPATPAATASNFSDLDCSYSWFNALWHHYGAFATATLDSLSPQLLAGRAVVIVPARVAHESSSQVRQVLEDFTRGGGQLVVEMPRQEWAHLTGLATSGEVRQARTITATEGLGFQGPLREHLSDVPLSGRLLPAADLLPRPTGPVVFAVEEQPGYLIQPLGEGQVHAVLFDFACSLVALHQGRPTRDLEFGPPGSDPWLPSSIRVAHERLLTAHVPYADLLQKALFGRLSEARPVPRLWPFPGKYRGALMTMLPSEDMPRAAIGYADWAHRNGAASTILATADGFTESQAALAREVSAQLGLIWIVGQTRPALAEPAGIGAIQPFLRELSLPQQQARLAQTIGLSQGDSIRLVRTEKGLFQNHWSETFRVMAAAGLRVDASFGPSEPSQFGYLFGTGMPFYPIDERGLPLPILESPFVLHGGSISSPRLQRMLGNSRTAFHQPLLVSLPADAMAKEPAAGILLGYRKLHEQGRAYQHWVTTLGDYVDFLTARRQSALTSQWSIRDSRLTISVNLLGARLLTAPEGAIPSVAIPRTFQGRDIERIEVDENTIRVNSLDRSGPGDELLLPLPPGRHVISVFYAPLE